MSNHDVLLKLAGVLGRAVARRHLREFASDRERTAERQLSVNEVEVLLRLSLEPKQLPPIKAEREGA